MSLFTDLVLHITTLLGFIKSNYDEKVVEEGLRECAKGIRRLGKSLKDATSIGEKQHLLTVLGQITSFRNQFKIMKKQGAGIKTRKETATNRVHWDDLVGAFMSRIRTGVISNLRHKDVTAFLDDCLALFRRRVQNVLKKDEAVKVNTTFCGEFELSSGDKIQTEFKYITTSNAAIYRDTNINEWFNNNIRGRIMIELEEFQEKNSGWALTKIVNLGVNINKFTPQLGSSYIELPRQIKQKKACVNVNNNDNACFAWAVLSALYPVEKDPQRITKYPHYSDVLNLTGISFPMTVKQVSRFEHQNDVSINVYILRKQKKNFTTVPTYLTKDKKEKHVNLLIVQNVYVDEDVEADDGCNDPIRYHYVWIKNLSRLASKQLSKHDGKKYFCDRCLHYFYTQEKLDSHTVDCIKLNKYSVRMPKGGENIVKFKNLKNKEKAPFIIYADLESLLKPIHDINKYQEHISAAVGYYVKCSYDDSLSFYRTYRGEDCMNWFAKELRQFAEDVETVFLCPYEMTPLTCKQQAEFEKATHCHICEKCFLSTDQKVHDHNHLIPENNYRGTAHNGCNINYKDEHVIPIVFHNLSGYDSHFIIESVVSNMKGAVNVLPVTKEKYISFTKQVDGTNIHFRFIDSLRFMDASLDTLTSYLKEFYNLRSQFSNLSEDQFLLLTKKGIMPYDYFDSFDRFSETVLPPIEAFYNKLEDRKCSRKLYKQAQHIWESFNCRTLGEYVDLYMKTDILLLADIFEQFRVSCLKTYSLDPAHYYTLPGYTWDCMLKHTGVELELLTDIDMLLFIERGTRGGLSQCSKRYAKANNKYMPTFDSLKPTSYLMYFDINNQYGWAMSQYLPYGEFEWVDTNIDVTYIPNDATNGYILEVDLEYPHSLHNKHQDLPFCSTHSDSPNRKLFATLHNKSRYVLHYRNLKQALANGLILTKIHRVLKFKQSSWLKSYIDLNTELRKVAKNEFEKNLFKLMNNAVFGKTMENIRKHSNVKLITRWEGRYGAEAMIARPEFKSSTIFNENLVAIELNKTEIFFNKPIYIGMCILDIAKTTIYDFHYGYMSETFCNECSVLYTDTDSLVYEIRNIDIYEIIRRDCQKVFDTDDYSIDNIYGIPRVNKKVIGLMKDENSGRIITEFVGLRSKLYSIKLERSENELLEKKQKLLDDGYDFDEIDDVLLNIGLTKKAKGVKKSIVKTRINFEDYIECLVGFTEKTIKQNLIRSERHKVYSICQTKIGLSPHDDKRYLIKGSYDTLPWGHYSIMNIS